MISYITSYLTIPKLSQYSIHIKPPIKSSSILVEFVNQGKIERITRIPTPLNYYSIVCEMIEKFGSTQFYYSIENETPMIVYFYMESSAKQMYEEMIEFLNMISNSRTQEEV